MSAKVWKVKVMHGVSAIKIYHTFDRSTLKIHRRLLFLVAVLKLAIFPASQTWYFCCEAFLNKLSPLSAVPNYGDWWGKLHHVTKHQRHPAVPLRWLARKIFSCPVRGRQFKCLWNWHGSVRVSAQGSSGSYIVNFHHKHSSLHSKCFCVSSPRKLGREQKKKWQGRGRGEKETLLSKPQDFEKQHFPMNAASDWCGALSLD